MSLTDAARRVLLDAAAAAADAAKRADPAARKAFMGRAYLSSMQDFVASVEALRADDLITETGAITATGLGVLARST